MCTLLWAAFPIGERAQVDNTKDHRLAAKITQAHRVAMNKPRSVEARRDLAGLYMQGGLFDEEAQKHWMKL